MYFKKNKFYNVKMFKNCKKCGRRFMASEFVNDEFKDYCVQCGANEFFLKYDIEDSDQEDDQKVPKEKYKTVSGVIILDDEDPKEEAGQEGSDDDLIPYDQLEENDLELELKQLNTQIKMLKEKRLSLYKRLERVKIRNAVEEAKKKWRRESLLPPLKKIKVNDSIDFSLINDK